jgi:hypothetical protein
MGPWGKEPNRVSVRWICPQRAWPRGRQYTYSIQLLDLDTMKLRTLFEDEKHDLLAPKLAADGTLYFIRRPYVFGFRHRSLWRWIEDILLLPYRLLYAFFPFLNIFSMMYTGKPLSPSGPFLRKEAEPANMIIWGNLLEARRTLTGDGGSGQSMAPASWELCRRSPQGTIEVLAKSVLSFDLETDGSLLFTNGIGIFRRSPGGNDTKIHKASLIRQVVALGPKLENSESGAVETVSTEATPLR